MSKKKLYEFTALLRCSVVVAAKTEKDARKEIETYEREWFETGEFIDVSDVNLFDVRKPKSKDLSDEAHVIC